MVRIYMKKEHRNIIIRKIQEFRDRQGSTPVNDKGNVLLCQGCGSTFFTCKECLEGWLMSAFNEIYYLGNEVVMMNHKKNSKMKQRKYNCYIAGHSFCRHIGGDCIKELDQNGKSGVVGKLADEENAIDVYENETVAILQEKKYAIDGTPIYHIRLLRNLKKGTVIEFDTDEFKIKEFDEFTQQ